MAELLREYAKSELENTDFRAAIAADGRNDENRSPNSPVSPSSVFRTQPKKKFSKEHKENLVKNAVISYEGASAITENPLLSPKLKRRVLANLI
jgi:hypothetical protein